MNILKKPIEVVSKVFGTANDRALKSIAHHVPAINGLEAVYEKMSDEELRSQTLIFKEKLSKGASTNDILHDSFAVVREVAKRTLGQRHFDVQLIGGIVLNQAKIAEMKTGEGKTLVATLPAYLNAISGKGVHVVTVNDYLAKRDSEWMGQIYRFLGLEVGCITGDISDDERRKAYAADITYGTNNEFGFDYLRDNMKFRLSDMVQRPFNYAIVDEVDSILIDEARTPLIISGPAESSTELYVAVNKVIPTLTENDYELDEKAKTVTLNEEGTEKVEKYFADKGLLNEGGLYDIQNIALVHHANQALKAHKLFARDKDYIVKDGRVVIIDEFTGRMMEGRRFSDGLHQALEAKESVKIQNENQTLASVTFQNYFRLYPKLAGMTGTALTEAAEFQEIYNLGVVVIPTNTPVSRKDHDDKIYKTLAEKDEVTLDLIKICHEKKQPILVGTISIEKSEKLSEKLKKAKIPHNVLNARHHEQEAYIIAQAGRPGAVTIATNMAGRGTDIKMGGDADMRILKEINPEWSEDKKAEEIQKIREEIKRDAEIVKNAGGLYVLGTERHESRRIDNQLRGRSGRQGDPGDSMFLMSLEDDLMRIFGSDKMEMFLANDKIGLKNKEALTHPLISKALERAQARVETHNFEIRKNLLKFDNVMNDQRKVIYEQRKEIMASEDVSEYVTDMRHELIEDIVATSIPANAYPEQWDIELLKNDTERLLGLEVPIEEWSKEEGIADREITDRIVEASDRKMAEKAVNIGKDIFRQIEKSILLRTLDQQWKDHLLSLDHLRQGINLRAFGQRDPLNEYKTEAFGMFEEMLVNIREKVVQTLGIIEFSVDQGKISMVDPLAPDVSKLQKTRQDPASQSLSNQGTRGEEKQEPLTHKTFDKNDPSTWTRVPRNAPCPCGSGKKYKHCHGKI